MIQRIKRAIKAMPRLHAFLLPFVEHGRRWVRPRAPRRVSVNLPRFDELRAYCIEVAGLVAQPTFVTVGANDGVLGDPVADLLLADPRWKGLLVEPVPSCFRRLQANYKDPERFSLEQVAVGPTAGVATFYAVSDLAREALPGLPAWTDQLGSFDRNHILKHLDGVLAPFVEEIRVTVVPLVELLRVHGIDSVQLLHIDTEGFDFEVMRSLDFNACTPTGILAEHLHLSPHARSEMKRFMEARGYDVVDCGSDYFGLRRADLQELRDG
jgi:FkbM family methyltransferase